MKSFAILRTNVGLTSNIKVMVDSEYNLSLSSIESISDLSSSKYKRVGFIKDNYYDELISYFYDNLPSETAFSIYNNNYSSIAIDYNSQFDELYYYGARSIRDNKYYSEEFEYFAPLYISPNNLPKGFIIFRVDGSGIGDSNKDNFKNDIQVKFKTIKYFSFSEQNNIGYWLNKNYRDNEYFPLTPFEMSFDNLEFSKWYGIDYKLGGYTSKSMFLESFYSDENELYEFDKSIFKGYSDNGLVFPNILNISFLFNDNPSTPDVLRKWSLNRYYGFYIDDIICTSSISPYNVSILNSNSVILSGNIIDPVIGTDPFLLGYNENLTYYIEYNNNYYMVESFLEDTEPILTPVSNGDIITDELISSKIRKFRILSDIDLTGKENDINRNIGYINSKRLLNLNGSPFVINDWESSDIWLIEIDGMYHNLIRDNGYITINSDYDFRIFEGGYEYWINSTDNSYKKVVNNKESNIPYKFNICKVKFTDIKDFDTRIIDTEYSKYEYEKLNELTQTDESKMYVTNLSSNTLPKSLDDYSFGGEVVNIPVSSEYTANYETFKIEDNKLSSIWNLNPDYCRWGFNNSLSSNDMPYLLNNSILFEDFNRTANCHNPIPNRVDRNLDHFYTINSSTYSYIHHSLHIESYSGDGLDKSFKFELDKYFNYHTYSTPFTQSLIYNFDYFTEFFERDSEFNMGADKRISKKYSLFNKGNESIPNMSVFRGIKYYIYNLDGVNRDLDGSVTGYNLNMDNSFDGYKLSVLLSKNEYDIIKELNTNSCYLTHSNNMMTWTIIEQWSMDKVYKIGDIVNMDDILYVMTGITTSTVNPQISNGIITAPYNQPNWQLYNISTILYNPNRLYNIGDICYNNDNYYVYAGGNDNIWNPYNTGYNVGDTVLFNGVYYTSMTSSNLTRPDYIEPYAINSVYNPSRSLLEGVPVYENIGEYYWTISHSNNKAWLDVELWDNIKTYLLNEYVIYNDSIYKCVIGVSVGDIPGISNNWLYVYSINMNTDYIYTSVDNQLIRMNDVYYLCTSNGNNSTLSNGINIFINKKWKNVLINIFINDNTVLNLDNVDRDELYNKLNSKLTANSMIESINNIQLFNGFSDRVSYVIVEDNGTMNMYNYDNIDDLPYIIFAECPDMLTIDNMLDIKPVNKPSSIVVKNVLDKVNLDLSNINYYNNIPTSANISKGVNNITNNLYRFSGFYMPIFYSIELFESPKLLDNGIYIDHNMRFNTNLTNFGLMREKRMRKVNHNGTFMKSNKFDDISPIYPMIDEYIYTYDDFYIFKSSWDIFYNYITSVDGLNLMYYSNNLPGVNGIGN